MKGLLLKDLYMTKKYCRTYLLIAAVFLAVSFVNSENLFFMFYLCMIVGMLPVTLLGYDERSKWDAYCGTLPYSKTQIVSAKYLTALLAMLCVLVLTAVAQAVRMITGGSFVWNDYLELMAIFLTVSLAAPSITLPFMFRYGVEKGRLAYYVMIGFVCAVGVAASGIFKEHLQMTAGFPALLLLCAGGVLLFAFSWYLSVVFYKAREIK